MIYFYFNCFLRKIFFIKAFCHYKNLFFNSKLLMYYLYLKKYFYKIFFIICMKICCKIIFVFHDRNILNNSIRTNLFLKNINNNRFCYVE